MDKKIINILHVAFVVFFIIIVSLVYLGLEPNPFVMTAMLAVCGILLMNSISEQIDEKVRKRMSSKAKGG